MSLGETLSLPEASEAWLRGCLPGRSAGASGPLTPSPGLPHRPTLKGVLFSHWGTQDSQCFPCRTHLGRALATPQVQGKDSLPHAPPTIAGDFITPCTQMDVLPRQKINKEALALKDTLDQIDSIDIYQTLHPKEAYTCFSTTYRSFSRKQSHVKPQRKSQLIEKD